MQIVSDSLYEMSKPIFWEKQENYHQFVISELTQGVVSALCKC